jgi:FlaA1/EpsC-like NDP-sugar epimerase
MLNKDIIASLFKGKNILITGGLGSIGSEIINQLIMYNPKQIKVFDNRETELFYFKQEFQNESNVEFLFGDIRDKERLDKATKGIDIIFHAAAMKHVIVCEYDPVEAVKTNVLGTQNVIDCAFNHQVEKLIHISTDKVVNPTNVMGATKLLAERLVSAMCNMNGNRDTKIGIVRFGNVLASRGSVLEIWDKQIKEGRKITITNAKMTRFFMLIPDSVNLVFEAAYYADRGETYILKMPSVRIVDLAEAFLSIKGLPNDHYEIIGTKPGEKMHEGLIFEDEAGLLMESSELFIRLPLRVDINYMMKQVESLGFNKSKLSSFSSENPNTLMSVSEIRKMLSDYYSS